METTYKIIQKGSNPTSKKSISIQVTGDCNLACTYCYQTHKNTMMVDINKAKKFIDKIVENDQSFWNGYINFEENKNGVILDFVGGEPLLNYKAVIELCDYFKQSCINHGKKWMYCNSYMNISTNGTIINKEITDLLNRHKGKITVSITVDGNKKLHDSCRRFKGSNNPSYDIVVKNLNKYRKYCNVISTKVTIAPKNLDYIAETAQNMWENLGFTYIASNCVYEDVWCKEDAKKLYWQLKKVADYLLEHRTPENDLYYGFFRDVLFHPEKDFCNSWCGGNGKMLFMQYDGLLFNCIRYSDTTTGKKGSLSIGNVEDGVVNTENVCLLKSITRDKYYDDQCRNCPVSKGCSDCIAYMYEVNGNFDTKIKSICDMHKARSLANVYYWNKYYIKNNIPQVFLMWLPTIEALGYIDPKEIDMLYKLSNGRYLDSLTTVNGELIND